MIKSELHQFLLSHRDYCNEKVFEKYFPEYYIEISKLVFPDDFKFSQKLYHYFNNDINLKLGYCLVCGNKCRFLILYANKTRNEFLNNIKKIIK